MSSVSTRLSILGLMLALGALITSPVLAGGRGKDAGVAGEASLTVELARGVLGNLESRDDAQDVYEPTGETVDLTVPVVAARVH